MIYYIFISKDFLNPKRFSDGKVVSLTKKEYGSAVYFL